MASLVLTENNFVSMLPKLFAIVKKVEKLEIKDVTKEITQDEALELYHSDKVFYMDLDNVSSPESFLDFVKEHA